MKPMQINLQELQQLYKGNLHFRSKANKWLKKSEQLLENIEREEMAKKNAKKIDLTHKGLQVERDSIIL